SVNALDKLEAFASFNGPDFYNLPRNRDSITLVKKAWDVPVSYPLGDTNVVPIRAGEQIDWQVE
ncbi:MAG: dihydroorotase, partial [Shewanella sp.]